VGAASASSDACGSWFGYRLTFHGDPFRQVPSGLPDPWSGPQRRPARHLELHLSGLNFTVFGVAKSDLYADARQLPTSSRGLAERPGLQRRHPDDLHAVQLLRQRGTRHRLPAVPVDNRAGRRLPEAAGHYQLFFKAPTAGQPAKYDCHPRPLDGRIQWSPVNDGSQIWFAHGIDRTGFPTCATRYRHRG